MKHIIVTLIFCLPIYLFSQENKYADIGPGWTKEKHRKIITDKMDDLINRVSAETDCKKEDITYIVVEKQSQFIKEDKRVPKIIIVKACGKKQTFINNTPINYGETLTNFKSSTWVLNSVSETK